MTSKSNNPAQPTLCLQKTSAPASEQPGPALTGELCPPETQPRRGGKRGRKPSASSSAAPRRRRRKLPPGRGALNLINAVNLMLHDESDIVARALIDKAIAGNTASARLLVELACARPRSAENDERRRKLLDEMLDDGPQWDDPPKRRKPDDPYPGESLEDYKIRTLGPDYRLRIEAERKAEEEAEAQAEAARRAATFASLSATLNAGPPTIRPAV